MTDWRSCWNCADVFCPFEEDEACESWTPIPCKYCGGALSEIREHNGRKYRHCYACHSEFFEEE